MSAPHNPAKPPVNPPSPDVDGDVQALQSRLRLFLLVLLGLVVVTQLELPFRLGGIVLALSGCWIGIRLIAGMVRGRANRPDRLGALGWVVTLGGLGLSGLLLLTLVTQAVYYPVVSDQEKCIAEANTRTAQQVCDQTAKRRLEELIRRLSHRPATP